MKVKFALAPILKFTTPKKFAYLPTIQIIPKYAGIGHNIMTRSRKWTTWSEINSRNLKKTV